MILGTYKYIVNILGFDLSAILLYKIVSYDPQMLQLSVNTTKKCIYIQ